MKLEYEGIVANVYYDDPPGFEAGWYAAYYDSQGFITDSEKIDHPPMPRRKSSSASAERIAFSFLKKLAREQRKSARYHANSG